MELESTNGPADFDGAETDIAIWFGTGNWPHVRAKRMLDVEASPVYSAKFLANNSELKISGDVLRFSLLGISHQQDLWSEWFRSAGIKGPERVSQAFDNFHLLYCAAASGLGIALGIKVIVKPYLEEAQLVRPFDSWRKLTKGYHVVCRSPRFETAAGQHISGMAHGGSGQSVTPSWVQALNCLRL